MIARTTIEEINPAEATGTKRGSLERADVYGARYEAGLPLWNPEDSLDTITTDEMGDNGQHAASRLDRRTAQQKLTSTVHRLLVEVARELGVDLDVTPPANRNEFAEWLKSRRESLGISQGEFSLASGFTQSDVSKWERRERVPVRGTIERMADALNRIARGEQ